MPAHDEAVGPVECSPFWLPTGEDVINRNRKRPGHARDEHECQRLTLYGGLEQLRPYFRLLGLHRGIRAAFSSCGLEGDHGLGTSESPVDWRLCQEFIAPCTLERTGIVKRISRRLKDV
jgi:hypothetical protein